jgi:hypothetical protein
VHALPQAGWCMHYHNHPYIMLALHSQIIRRVGLGYRGTDTQSVRLKEPA